MRCIASLTIVVVSFAAAACRPSRSPARPEPKLAIVEFVELGPGGRVHALFDCDGNPVDVTVLNSATATLRIGGGLRTFPMGLLGDGDAPRRGSFPASVHDLDFRAWTAARVGKRCAVVAGDQVLTEFTVSAASPGFFDLPEPNVTRSVSLQAAFDHARTHQPFDDNSP